jgi:hypothetical protein
MENSNSGRSDSSPSLTFKFSNSLNKELKSPNSPLIKSPYIKLKIEGKNLEKSLINSNYLNNEKKNINHFIQNISRYFISLTPFVKITLNNQTITTKAIAHNSPVWLDEYEFEIKNIKTDKIVLEIFTKTLLINNFKNESDIKTIHDPIFLGFQIIPIKYLERTNKIGERKTIWLRLINKKQEEYFLEDKLHVLNIDNHDPDNYKIDENLIKKEKDIGVPLIKITFEYVNFFYLWLLNCSVHSIIRRDDPNSKKIVNYYKLYIKRNDSLEWFKDATFEEIEKFRNCLCKFVKEIENIPFPMKSILSYVPFIGSYYSDENNDVLIEKKIILDNFFEQVCLNFEVYKLEVFNSFFKEN